jgi:hypothetical protein
MRPDKDKLGDQCEQFICDITGGAPPKIRPKPKSSRYIPTHGRRGKRSVVDVVSGNGTRLEVKWSGGQRQPAFSMGIEC